ncbi:unnamed protein product [Adineta ricciae]|uniref:Uncharacterized protein n=1 Tax=Adineta ricciae TaxID=249248 RepID=A0A815U559_ADIRI|nr:unnamed protein product [Adineta ricciae]
MNIFIFIVFIIQIGFVFKLNNETVASLRIESNVRTTTEYMYELFSFSPTFVRPNGDTNQLYYYHAISVRIFMTGVYTFTSKSEIDTYGSLHNDAVDLSNPSKSMIVYDDDSGDGSQFRISRDLQSVEGPASVILTENFHLISESTTPTITSTYSGILPSNSPLFS